MYKNKLVSSLGRLVYSQIYGYKLQIFNPSFIYSGLHIEKPKYTNIWNNFLSLSLFFFLFFLGHLKPPKLLLFRILSFQFRFLAKSRHCIKRRPHVWRTAGGPEAFYDVLRCVARAIFPLFVRNEDHSPQSKKKGKFLAMVPSSRSMASIEACSVFLSLTSPFFFVAVELFDLQILCSAPLNTRLLFRVFFWAPLNICILFRVFFWAPLNICILFRVFFWAPIFIFEALDCLFFFFFFLPLSWGFNVVQKIVPMASLKVYGKCYSANVNRVLTTLAEKKMNDYQIVPIELLTGAHLTPEYRKLQVLAVPPPSLFHLSSPQGHFQVYYSSWGLDALVL